MPVEGVVDYAPLGASGISTIGNVLPDSKTHWARPLYVGMTTVMAAYFFSKAHMDIGGSYPLGGFLYRIIYDVFHEQS